MYEIFAKLLESKGLKAADVSRATGIKSPVFSEWKKGKSKPNTEKMIKIANFLDVSVEYLTTGKEKELEKREPGLYIGREDGTYTRYDFSSLVYSIMEAVEKMPPEQQEMVNKMVEGKRRKKNFIVVHNPENRRNQTNAAHSRTDIDLPENVDTSDDDIMDDDNF